MKEAVLTGYTFDMENMQMSIEFAVDEFPCKIPVGFEASFSYEGKVIPSDNEMEVMMKIQQKVIKAWAGQRRVAVTEKNAEPIWGKILTFNPNDNSFCLLNDDAEKKIYRIADLIDIRFVGEEGVSLEEAILEALGGALENGNEVEIRYEKHESQYRDYRGYVEEIVTTKRFGSIQREVRFKRKAGVGFTCDLSSITDVEIIAQPDPPADD